MEGAVGGGGRMSTSPHRRFQTQPHRRRRTISSQAPASRSICGSMHSPATSSTAHAYRLRATLCAPTLARHHAPPTGGNRRTASGARCDTLRGRSGCPVRGEVGVPCQPPRVPPNATTSPRDGLRAPVQAAHRPPSRGRRRRDNDRPTPPGPACNGGGFLAVATHNNARGDLHKSPPGETRNGDCSPLHSLKRCVSPRRQRLAVVKWYESTLTGSNPTPPAWRSAKQNPTERRANAGGISDESGLPRA